MKNLNFYIEAGEKKTGGTRALERALGVPQNTISMVKAGKRGLKTIACAKLADLLNEDEAKIIFASELITENDEQNRKFLQKKLEALAACILLASVVNFVTPTPAEAAPVLNSMLQNNVYYVKFKRLIRRLKSLFAGWKNGNPTNGALPAYCPG